MILLQIASPTETGTAVGGTMAVTGMTTIITAVRRGDHHTATAAVEAATTLLTAVEGQGETAPALFPTLLTGVLKRGATAATATATADETYVACCHVLFISFMPPNCSRHFLTFSLDQHRTEYLLNLVLLYSPYINRFKNPRVLIRSLRLRRAGEREKFDGNRCCNK